MKKRFLIVLSFGAALGLLILAGLSCTGRVSYPASPIANWLPATESEFQSYVMPECSSVEHALRDILGDPPYVLSQAGFDAIRDWVAANTDYVSDQKRWGEDYWQTPEETLAYHSGDCEDFSILLCSLLRAYGINATRVYVVLGADAGKDGHAFLMEDWNQDGEWRKVESQAPAQVSSRYPWLELVSSHPDSELDKYEITAAFNDFYYYDESFPWGEDQASTRSLGRVASAVGNIAKELSQLFEYFLELLFN
ncbi:MAG: transglutaminase domain-containing protein [Dehalococcoidia bacterium]